MNVRHKGHDSAGEDGRGGERRLRVVGAGAPAPAVHHPPGRAAAVRMRAAAHRTATRE